MKKIVVILCHSNFVHNFHHWACNVALKREHKFILPVNKTNRCTEFQFYWYYECTRFGQPFCPSSGVLNRTSALVHFMQLWWQFAIRSRMELHFHRAPGSQRSS